jgi:tetratricopeptide (TPR) repeat protein
LNTKDYTYLLNKPYSITERQTAELESILTEFPYLQSARAIYLKGLYNRDSFRYNSELKKTAAYTTDRSVLFDYIISEDFRSIDKVIFEEEEKALSDIVVKGSEVVSSPPANFNKLEESIKYLVKEANTEVIPVVLEDKESAIEITTVQDEVLKAEENEIIEDVNDKKPSINSTPGSPLDFNENETHSFAEWLQLSKLAPIQREVQETPIVNEDLDKKYSLINKFIAANPKIAPVKKDSPTPANTGKGVTESPGLMTETLARVYLEQKKYTKAIQAYEILILKYPEKISFFADRISEIKNLQQNNN